MQDYQREFIHFAQQRGALRFGEFTLKSGRISPYFFNAGDFCSGEALARLGRYYAAAIAARDDLQFDLLFGPAYKGIPLVATVSVALAEHHGRDYPWCFNRKETKDHGEGGVIVGAPLEAGMRVLIIDDVISAGTAVRETMRLLQAQKAHPAGVVIALDRQERGTGERSAIQEVEHDYRVPVLSVITLEQLIQYAQQQQELAAQLGAMHAYRERYGVKS